MASPSLIPAGDFRTSYAVDTTIFPTTTSRNFAILGVVLMCFAPQLLSEYWLSQYPLSNCGTKQTSTTPRIAMLRLVVVGKIVVSCA